MDSTYFSRILLFEGGVIAMCLAVTFCLSTLLNLFERRKQPMTLSKIYLPIVAGAATSVFLTIANVARDAVPNWVFGFNILLGMGAGYITYLLAPSKMRLKSLLRKHTAPSAAPEVEPDPVVRVVKLPEKARPKIGRKHREAEALANRPSASPGNSGNVKRWKPLP